ncbi:MAG: DUF4349 domain-containing protein [Lachnospiraceae bacterium]|nr:DUF4349 domain-containing protein [Lachnospiraceae bacterium]
MKKRRILILGVITSLVLAGCGGSKEASVPYEENYMADEAVAAAAPEAKSYAGDYDYEEYDGYEEEMVTEEAYDTASSEGAQVNEEEVKESAESSGNKRMLIKTVHMNVESEDIDSMVKNVEKRVEELGGYVENLSVNNQKYSNSETKTADLTARVPVEKLDMFVNEVEGQSNVLSRSSNAEDVTLRYVDMQARMDSLQTEYDRISELLKEADSLDNIIELENRLTDIRYEMQSYGAQMKAMKNQATYSTIYLNIKQVIEYTPVVEKEKTRIERMTEGFIQNCKKVGNGVLDFFVGLIVALPVLLIWAVVITIIVLIIKFIIRKSSEKHPRKEKVRGRKNRRSGKGGPETDDPVTAPETNNTQNKEPENKA